jgi:hypothetical protein
MVWKIGICARPVTCWFTIVKRIALQIRSPLTINFYLKLKDSISTVTLIPIKLSQLGTHEVFRVLTTIEG